MSESEITQVEDVPASDTEPTADGGGGDPSSLKKEETEALLGGEAAASEVTESDSADAADSSPEEAVPEAISEEAALAGEATAEAVAEQNDLATRALEAAEALIEERELDEKERLREAAARDAEAAKEREAEAKRKRRKQRQDRILVGLLVANMVLMGVMMFIPGSKDEGHTPPEPTTPHGPGKAVAKHEPSAGRVKSPVKDQPDPFHAPLQEPGGMLPNPELYEEGQKKVAIGAYDRARELFERYVTAHPELQAYQLTMVYSALAYCHERLGQRLKAQGYIAKIENLRQITALPDELWEAARLAEKDGRGRDMRKYYARFLLQQNQLGKRWANQGRIAEAYVKIGDSYRLDAEVGRKRDARRKSAEDELMMPTGKKKPKKKEPETKAKGGH